MSTLFDEKQFNSDWEAEDWKNEMRAKHPDVKWRCTNHRIGPSFATRKRLKMPSSAARTVWTVRGFK